MPHSGVLGRTQEAPAGADGVCVSLLPAIHRLVTITDEDGREYRSRVEDVGDGMLTLARPLTLPVEHPFRLGRLLLVSWPDPDGLTLATVRLAETRQREHLGLWLTAVEDLRRQQRRQFVRVPALGPIELMAVGAPAGEPFPHVAGQLLDVSEAGLRCLLHSADADALAGTFDLLVSFAVAEARFTLPAALLRTEASRKGEQLTECVLTFEVDDRMAGDLRRLVFAEQLRLRRSRTG